MNSTDSIDGILQVIHAGHNDTGQLHSFYLPIIKILTWLSITVLHKTVYRILFGHGVLGSQSSVAFCLIRRILKISPTSILTSLYERSPHDVSEYWYSECLICWIHCTKRFNAKATWRGKMDETVELRVPSQVLFGGTDEHMDWESWNLEILLW